MIVKRQIINIVNFIRGCEPRPNRDIDLIRPINEQIKLMNKYNFKGTFLVQYDALVNPEFTNILKALPADRFEIGLWFEIVQEQAEAAGIEWKGQYSWDHRSNFAMPVGYEPEVREKIIDLTFAKFHEVFGFYPKSVGGWVLDAHSLRYISEKYGADAFCNCKDQYGTDGYTLWGGYYNQGYYPNVNNAFCPAQTEEKQINAPIFRMLGSDPVYQYDLGVDKDAGPKPVQDVLTLECICPGGGNPEWTDWYFENNFSGNCLSFGYSQTGQENSFGWDMMEKGLKYQFERMAKLQKAGKLSVEKLCKTGEWFKNTYKSTPPSSIVGYNSSRGSDDASVWYCCKNYRINFFKKGSEFKIRDLYIFDENYSERYNRGVCEGAHSIYDNLPVTDGNALSGHGILGGIYFETAGKNPVLCRGLGYEELDDEKIRLTVQTDNCGDIEIVAEPGGISISSDKDFVMLNKIDNSAPFAPGVKEISEKKIVYSYRDFEYGLTFEKGKADKNGAVLSEGGQVRIKFSK